MPRVDVLWDFYEGKLYFWEDDREAGQVTVRDRRGLARVIAAIIAEARKEKELELLSDRPHAYAARLGPDKYTKFMLMDSDPAERLAGYITGTLDAVAGAEPPDYTLEDAVNPLTRPGEPGEPEEDTAIGPFEGSGVAVNNRELCSSGHLYIHQADVRVDEEHGEIIVEFDFTGGNTMTIYVTRSDLPKIRGLLRMVEEKARERGWLR